MKDSLAERLKNLEAPAPGAEARAAARRAALAEFARVQDARVDASAPEASADSPTASQGFWPWLRLSRNHNGGSHMKLVVSRTMFGGIASAGVTVFAVAVLWPMFRNSPDLKSTQPPVAVESTIDLQKSAEPHRIHPEPMPNVLPVPVEAPLVAISPAPEVGYSSMPAPSEAMPPGTPPVVGNEPARDVVVDSRQEAVNVVDSITAEDIGQSPQQYSPEELQRISGQTVGQLAKKEKNARADAKVIRLSPGSNRLPLARPTDPTVPFEAEGDDKFQHFEINPIRHVSEAPVSTFSVDVDTASYSFARRMINDGRLPQKDAVRVEEMVNYFDYAWPKPESRKTPFAATVVVSDSPWNKGKKLVHVGIKGYEMNREDAPDANLVFLMDVSGSMNSPDKLPLAVASMKLLLQRLKATDTVAIVVYAGAAGTVLEPTAIRNEDQILKALDSLQAGGSTAGAEGIELAYQLAEKHFRKGGVNRVLLATDGDFNVGIDNTEELKSFIERKREKGIFLSVLGFGQGNYRDELAQALAQNGNGVAAYIDTLNEAKKVMVEQSTGSLFTIAKDVKLQVEFNPRTVAEYRLVGYETRSLKREDFNNDKVDAGDVGAGHTVTAMYEITPVGSSAASVDALRYGEKRAKDLGGSRNEYGFLKIRYKLPEGDTSTLVTQPIPIETPKPAGVVQREVAFSTAVAGFAQLLKGGTYTGTLDYEDVIEQAQGAKGEDRNGYRAEFVELVKKAKSAKGM
jgi:Ca-activated chloride channel homolog